MGIGNAMANSFVEQWHPLLNLSEKWNIIACREEQSVKIIESEIAKKKKIKKLFWKIILQSKFRKFNDEVKTKEIWCEKYE